MVGNDTQTSGNRADDSSTSPTKPAIPGTASRRHLLYLLGAGGLTGIAGCSSSSPDEETDPTSHAGTETSTEPSTATEPPELHQHAIIGVDTGIVSRADYFSLAHYTRVFEPLIWTTPELEVKPWLVTEWDRTGKLTWEFTLRDGVRYHNGDRLTADRLISMMEQGLEHYFGGVLATPRAANTTPEGVTKVDELRIEMETIEPTVNQPANLALHAQFGAHPAGSVYTERDFSTLIGTGPYRIDTVEKNEHVELSAFDSYWGGAPHMEKLTVRQFDDQNTLALALKGQEIDVGLELPANQLDPIENTQATKTATRTAPKRAGVSFNLRKSPMSDVDFRKALNYAISQEKVVTATQNGLGVPARGLLSPIVWFSAHDDLPPYGPDKDKAKHLVEQSRYSGETLELISQSQQPRGAQLITQLLQEELSDIGVDVEAQFVGINAHTDRVRNGDFDLTLGEGTNAAPDEPFLESLRNRVTKDTPRMDLEPEVEKQLTDLFETARTSTGETKKDALQKAQHVIMDEALELPLYHEKYLVGMKNGVKGVDWHPVSFWSRIENLKYVK